MPPSSPPPLISLDERALARLHELDPDGRLGVVRRVMVAFETSLLRMTASLIEQQVRGDRRAVAAVAHTLKSSSASVGALALSAACAHTESRLRDDPQAPLAPEIEQLLTAAGSALVAVRAILHP